MCENLKEKYKNTTCYYKNEAIKDLKNIICVNFTQANAQQFIEKIFEVSGKGPVINLINIEQEIKYEKSQHTVSLFFLGLSLFDIIKTDIENQIQSFSNISDIQYDTFDYIWFLTCLYHDIASGIEDEKVYSKNNLNFYLGNYNINHNLFNHTWEKNHPYLYSQELITNYFQYVLDYHNKIEHGIIAGFLLYDKLIKNYDRMYNLANNEYNKLKYDNFEYKNLQFRKHHKNYYAYAAHAIMGHNIWYNGDIQLYKYFGLEALISKPNNRIKIKEHPLLFYLGVLDTIEPIKKLSENNNENEILENIKISYTPKTKTITIKYTNKLNKEKIEEWIKSINSLEDWLDLEVHSLENNKKIEIKINYN